MSIELALLVLVVAGTVALLPLLTIGGRPRRGRRSDERRSGEDPDDSDTGL